MSHIGDMYAEGQGVPKDEAEAVKWYRKAAEKGFAKAQQKLGDMYKDGRGVAKDAAEAKKWHNEAAKQNVKAGK